MKANQGTKVAQLLLAVVLVLAMPARAIDMTLFLCNDKKDCNPSTCTAYPNASCSRNETWIDGNTSNLYDCNNIQVKTCVQITGFANSSCSSDSELGQKYYTCDQCKGGQWVRCVPSQEGQLHLEVMNCSQGAYGSTICSNSTCEPTPLFTLRQDRCETIPAGVSWMSGLGLSLVRAFPCRALHHIWFPDNSCEPTTQPGTGDDWLILDTCIWAESRGYIWTCPAETHPEIV